MSINVGGAGAAANTSLGESVANSKKKAVEDFLAYMNKTPAQRMEDAWLSQHGMTREELEALPPDEKRKVLEKMREDIKAELKRKAEEEAMKKLTGEAYINPKYDT